MFHFLAFSLFKAGSSGHTFIFSLLLCYFLKAISCRNCRLWIQNIGWVETGLLVDSLYRHTFFVMISSAFKTCVGTSLSNITNVKWAQSVLYIMSASPIHTYILFLHVSAFYWTWTHSHTLMFSISPKDNLACRMEQPWLKPPIWLGDNTARL